MRTWIAVWMVALLSSPDAHTDKEPIMQREHPLRRSTRSLHIEPIPRPPADQNQYLGFYLGAPWMEGAVRVRFPEDVNSSLGKHFLDNVQPEVPRVSPVEYPEWAADPETGGIAYKVVTLEGLEFGGTVWAEGDRVEMALTVRNGTGETQEINAQVCFDLEPAGPFSRQDTLDTTYAWLDGRYQSLADTTPFREDKRSAFGARWVLALMKGYDGNDLRAIENDMPWWIVDQTSDHPAIVRVTPDRRHLLALTWDHEVRRLMSNTRIPCLHADPLWASRVADGETVVWRGRLYLTENDPENLLHRMSGDRTGPLRRGAGVTSLP